MTLGSKFRPGEDAELSLSAVATGTGTEKALNDCRQITWEVVGAGTISGGTVKIESAPTSAYAGTWHELDSVDASSLTGGATYHNTYPGMLAFVRGRISSNITGGGSISVRLNGLLG